MSTYNPYPLCAFWDEGGIVITRADVMNELDLMTGKVRKGPGYGWEMGWDGESKGGGCLFFKGPRRSR